MALKKIYELWIRFGHILGTINSYIIMTLVYFLVIAPISLMLKLFRTDVLQKKKPETTNWQPIQDSVKDIDFYKRLS